MESQIPKHLFALKLYSGQSLSFPDLTLVETIDQLLAINFGLQKPPNKWLLLNAQYSSKYITSPQYAGDANPPQMFGFHH